MTVSILKIFFSKINTTPPPRNVFSFRKAAYPSIRIPSSIENESINHVKSSQRLVIG